MSSTFLSKWESEESSKQKRETQQIILKKP